MRRLMGKTHKPFDLPMEIRVLKKDARRDAAMPPIPNTLNRARLMRDTEHFSHPLWPTEQLYYVDFRIHALY